ncbi:MAG: DUF3124 domain-containing protein [Rhizobiales bacterium]|jgi:hypothetical protein|nr:DUF3124 domain-containing protein [Hyphomicrobiales bacterium]
MRINMTFGAALCGMCLHALLGMAAQAADNPLRFDLSTERAKAATVANPADSSLSIKKQSYLPLYSSVALGGGSTTVHLGANVTLRNISTDQPLVVTSARYFDRAGELVTELATQAFTLKPMATIEVFIPITEQSVGLRGGRGGSILLEWAAQGPVPEPIMEALVLGSSGPASFSFISRSQPVRMTQ